LGPWVSVGCLGSPRSVTPAVPLRPSAPVSRELNLPSYYFVRRVSQPGLRYNGLCCFTSVCSGWWRPMLPFSRWKGAPGDYGVQNPGRVAMPSTGRVGTPKIYTTTGFGLRTNREMAGVCANCFKILQFALKLPSGPHQPCPYFF